MTLATWQQTTGLKVGLTQLGSRARLVYAPDVWGLCGALQWAFHHLDDYTITSKVGMVFWLDPRS